MVLPKNNAPAVGIVIGVIVVLIFVIVSLGINISKTQKNYEDELGDRIKAEEAISQLKQDILRLEEEKNILRKEIRVQKNLSENLTGRLADLRVKYEGLKNELNKVNKLKEQLESDLKEALFQKT